MIPIHHKTSSSSINMPLRRSGSARYTHNSTNHKGRARGSRPPGRFLLKCQGTEGYFFFSCQALRNGYAKQIRKYAGFSLHEVLAKRGIVQLGTILVLMMVHLCHMLMRRVFERTGLWRQKEDNEIIEEDQQYRMRFEVLPAIPFSSLGRRGCASSSAKSNSNAAARIDATTVTSAERYNVTWYFCWKI